MLCVTTKRKKEVFSQASRHADYNTNENRTNSHVVYDLDIEIG